MPSSAANTKPTHDEHDQIALAPRILTGRPYRGRGGAVSRQQLTDLLYRCVSYPFLSRRTSQSGEIACAENHPLRVISAVYMLGPLYGRRGKGAGCQGRVARMNDVYRKTVCFVVAATCLQTGGTHRDKSAETGRQAASFLFSS